jgi:arylsulfatase A-like enzyme/Flp pilus assembly protein TadD
LLILYCCLAASGSRPAQQSPAPTTGPRNLLIITIDTLRADRVGAYGYSAARTPALDGLARDGVRFTQAFATAPITLTSHASLLTGRYPAGHGARHNGIRLDLKTPTLAEALAHRGLATAAFVAAFPLDRRFGLIKGFQTYGDRLPRGQDGRPLNERTGRVVVDEALAWLGSHRTTPFFMWVHLFEPHAPYGDPANPSERAKPASARYDDEVAEADRQVTRLLDGLGTNRASTLIVAAADHGEAFGEHGEIGHSIFIYDTTLRVPLVLAGPGVPGGRTVEGPVSLVDVAPTIVRLLGGPAFDADGIDLSSAIETGRAAPRELYAESFAPLFDFGWSPLRSVRGSGMKYIDAPRPELYDLDKDRAEQTNIVDAQPPRAAELQERVSKYAGPDVTASASTDPETRARLQALGYASGSKATKGGARPDPKDRRELAARLAQVASGELHGGELEAALRKILSEDPANPQAHLRLGYVLLESNRCREALPHFTSAVNSQIPTADAYLGIAGCAAAERRFDAAANALRSAEQVEPDNPVVLANLGLVLSDAGRPADAIAPLQRALSIDPDFHRARFALALALARAGRRADAAATARELLQRMPADAPQRPEAERLLKAVQ